MKIPLYNLNYDDQETLAINEVLRSKWISMGDKVNEFERRFAALHDVEFGVGLSSCTAALQLALKIFDIKKGDDVIVPSFTFAATANCVVNSGANPVFADISSLNDWTINVADVKSKITDRTKAIIAMHYAGHGSNMKVLRQIADEYKLWLIEDACHAPGATLGDQKLGSFGDVACYSFYSNKNIAIGEGGMLITKNKNYADRAKLLRSHGMTTSAYDRVKGKAFYDIMECGFNYRMDDIHGALGCVQLDKLHNDLESRKKLVKRYRKNLDGCQNIKIPFENYYGQSANYIFAISVENIDREKLRTLLHTDGVSTSMHYPPLHLYPCYSCNISLPLTEQISATQLSLPLYTRLKEFEVDYVCESLIKHLNSV